MPTLQVADGGWRCDWGGASDKVRSSRAGLVAYSVLSLIRSMMTSFLIYELCPNGALVTSKIWKQVDIDDPDILTRRTA